MPPLTILYRDDHYVAIDKPAGMLVHRTRIAEEGEYALQRLRDQLDQHVYTVHRLDRPTSGVLLFALSSEAARHIASQFEHHTVEKHYLAVVRGYTDEYATIDYPLQEEPHKPHQEAVTTYQRLATVELDIPVGRYPTARYSLLEVIPRTGRLHQIRKHLHHIFHPIVGDTTHGEGRHNRLFRDHFASQRLLLFATRLNFIHPYSGERITIEAPLDRETKRLFTRLGWSEQAGEGE
jgi:tRNA pseudouridine65 synthase